jgi:tetratricopeptide (TPR) repeat protein
MSAGRFSSLEFEDGKDSSPAQKPADNQPAEPGEAATPATPRVGAETRDAAWYLRRAAEEELLGNFEQSMRNYSAALGENPLLLDAWAGQLLMLLELEEYPETRLWADKAMEKFPEHPLLLAAKSAALFRMGMKREARDLNDAALAKKGESEIVWLFRGELMLGDNRAAADECFKHASRLAVRKDLARLRQGRLYLRYGRLSHALAALQEATAALPRAALAWYLLGRAQEQLGMLDLAQTSFQQATELAPSNAAFTAAAYRRPTLLKRFTSWLRRMIKR